MRNLALLGLVLLSVTAVAITTKRVILYNEHLFKAPVILEEGATLGGVGARLARTGLGTVDYAFPFDAGCQSSFAVSVAGAKKGDACALGIGPVDGGTAITTAAGALGCVVTADATAVVRLCPAAAAIADGGYSVRTFSLQ